MHTAPGKLPSLIFSVRERVEERAEGELGMLRALDTVAYALTQAAPILRTHTGSGSVEKAYVTLGEPWLHTEVKTESVLQYASFWALSMPTSLKMHTTAPLTVWPRLGRQSQRLKKAMRG